MRLSEQKDPLNLNILNAGVIVSLGMNQFQGFGENFFLFVINSPIFIRPYLAVDD